DPILPNPVEIANVARPKLDGFGDVAQGLVVVSQMEVNRSPELVQVPGGPGSMVEFERLVVVEKGESILLLLGVDFTAPLIEFSKSLAVNLARFQPPIDDRQGLRVL